MQLVVTGKIRRNLYEAVSLRSFRPRPFLSRELTKRLRQIRNARHFWFALNLEFTAQCFKFGGSVAHYLTRRYVNGAHLENISSQKW